MRRLLSACLFLYSSMVFALDPLVSVEITVLNDSGAPMEGVEVVGTFLGVSDFHTDVKTTDEFGVTVVRGRSLFPVGLITKKEGYYPTAAKVDTTEIVDNQVEYKDRKVIMTLRDKRNPIPLYAKHYRGYIPVAKEWLGFDLKMADWVVPYGKGAVSDIYFLYVGEFRGFDDAQGELKVKLVGYGGGINKIYQFYPYSELKSPYVAPVSGYNETEIIWIGAIGRKVDRELKPSSLNNYFLRLRAAISKDGVIETANYAKLYGDVEFSLRSLKEGVSRIKFTYYFNAVSNDRNLEFDVDKNLFVNLKHDEKVYEP